MSLDLAAIRRTYHDLCAQIRADPRTGLSTWTLGLRPGDLLTRPLICVATENMAPALDFLDHHANVVGIVNDFKIGTPFGRHRCISTADMIDLHRKDPETILVNSTVLQATQRYFNRVASQNDIPTLSLLQLYRSLRLIDAMLIPIRPYGLLEAYDLLAFFDSTIDLEPDYARVEAGLNGTFSKITLYSLLLQRLTGDTGWHLDVCVGNHMKPLGLDTYMFNSRFFEFGDNEVYVDAGAYCGDTVELFASSVHYRFDGIHAFEPDPVNFAQLEALVLARFGPKHERVHCHRAGVWERTGKLGMRSYDGDGRVNVSSHFDLLPDGVSVLANSTEVKVVALDDYLADERVTFIKLEVEGSEGPALRGARQLIVGNRPKLAVSAYHRARDLVELFDTIKSLDVGYRISLAHHRESISAGVYYCAPPH